MKTLDFTVSVQFVLFVSRYKERNFNDEIITTGSNYICKNFPIKAWHQGENGKSYIKTKYYEIKESIMSDSVNNDVAP